MFSYDITNFETYCSLWAFPAWKSPAVSVRKPGKKHNQMDVRLQSNTPKKKLLHTVKNGVVLTGVQSPAFKQIQNQSIFNGLTLGMFGVNFCPDIRFWEIFDKNVI